ncbi:hypothetical protein G7939_19175 (plasmid) [Ralstonia solanacearum]|nr:hypothetical protein [Ralstonia pseudosolanacearum]QIK25583.1 hypothetical protein G7939_19175 [Ralstonia solanacearum]MCK4115982.1 hypothetical protein [Ralstonia pseudosolanacearum]MCK4131260.1 hypothetical protein [Ralstonia pseudosolanacearum]MCK4141193.1 hypothetical protein [Ralstonia pseudosolanacearum]MDC6283785.1 hypothetical protein [Ralstonia pseudosolanacearum]
MLINMAHKCRRRSLSTCTGHHFFMRRNAARYGMKDAGAMRSARAMAHAFRPLWRHDFSSSAAASAGCLIHREDDPACACVRFGLPAMAIPSCRSGGLVASRVEGMNDAMRGCAQVAGASGGGQAN